MTTIILVSIIGSIIAAVIGTIWYSDKTPMGKLHMEYVGFSKLSKEEQQQKIKESMPQMPKMYAGQLLLSLLTAFVVSLIMIMGVRNGLSLSMAYGFVAMNWLCFMVPVIGSSILWGNCDRNIAWKKFFYDSASNLVTVLVIAFVASFFV
jgi:archaellum biogenesis protein FlaJ (TadC family)